MAESQDNGSDSRDVRKAFEEFLKKLQQELAQAEGEIAHDEFVDGFAEEPTPQTPSPKIPVCQPPTEEERIPYYLVPPERCFICGEMPTAGTLMPTGSVLYFCEEHLKTGKELAGAAWEAEKAKEREKEAQELKEKWRRRILQTMLATAKEELDGVGERCENCGANIAIPFVSADGTLLALCPDCGRELSTIDPDLATLEP